ncbi:MAG TPA: ParA family protein [Chthoniobacterales bacterium]|jgi:chromosome partitioning protein
MKIVAVANQKGGVGKTTTSVNLAACLAAMGRKILLVDLDPQGNATSALGVTATEEKSCYGPLLGESKLADNIISTRFDNLSLVPADLDLAGVEIEVARLEDHLVRLRNAVAPLRKSAPFDYILLDCPPSLGILMTNALAAADVVLVPLQAEYFALEGLTRIMEVTEHLHTVNPGLKVEGIVMTMVDNRTNLSQQVVAEVKSHFPEIIYKTMIPRSVRLGEAPSFGKPILEYDPASLAAFAYTALAGEFLRRDNAIGKPSDEPADEPVAEKPAAANPSAKGAEKPSRKRGGKPSGK